LIINDNVTIAKEIGADGVHLGKNDMHPTEAREILGGEAIIGGTANTIEDVVQLSGSGVNYIGLGPYRFTTTKDKLSPILGLEGYMKIMREVQMMSIDIPIIAIGGIVPGDVAALMETGIYGVAVSSAINQSIDKHSVIKEFITKTVSSV
jgi:thiamine-phosphate pyrophosphorylase